MDLNFPIEKDMEAPPKEGSTNTFKRDPKRYSMIPWEDGKTADNKLFFMCFAYNRFRLFENWPDLANYYLKFFVHFVQVGTEDGGLSRRMVICERGMNKYARQISDPNRQVTPPFQMDENGRTDCAFCDFSGTYWEDYKNAKSAAGIDGLTKEEFKLAMKNNPHVGKFKEQAIKWGPTERYFFLVFDYAKYSGERPLDKEDGGEIQIQGYWGPETIVNALYKKKKANYKFWDLEGNGGRVVIITRDNTRGREFCEYFVEIDNNPVNFDGATLEYLQNSPNAPDPSDDVLIWSEEQKKAYITTFGKNGNGRAKFESTEDDPPVQSVRTKIIPRPASVSEMPIPQEPPKFAAPTPEPPKTPEIPKATPPSIPRRTKVWR